MWKVRIYYNTGFNVINCPDSEATLEAAATGVNAQQLPGIPNQAKTHPPFADFPTAVDCLQRFHLNSISVRAFEDDVIQADYLKLYDDKDTRRFAFYSINGYTMTSGDTIDLDITMDPLLTCGGVEQIEFLDGVTRRHHIPQGNDEFGEFEEDDDLLVPTHPVKKVLVGSYYNDVHLDLVATSQYSLDHSIEIRTNNILLEASGGGESTDPTNYTGHTGRTEIVETGVYNKTAVEFKKGNIKTGGTLAVTRYFRIKEGDTKYLPNFLGNIKTLIEGGRTDIVEDAYYVPKQFLEATTENDSGTNSAQITKITVPNMIKPYLTGYVGAKNFDFKVNQTMPETIGTYAGDSGGIWSNYTEAYCDIDLSKTGFAAGIHNKRAFYGKHFAYTFICPSSGDSVSLNPEQLHIKGLNPITDDYKYPAVYASPDVRSNGCVTYFIATKGNNYDERKPVYPTKIKSATWPKADIVTIAGSGSTLNRALYETKSALADISLEADRWAEVNKKGGINNWPIVGDFARSMREAKNLRDQGVGGNQFHLGFNRLMYGIGGTLSGGIIGEGHQAAVSSTMGNAYSSGLSNALNNYSGGNKGGKDYFERAAAKQQELMQFDVDNIPQVQLVSKASGADADINGYGVLIYRNIIDERDVHKFDQILSRYGYKISDRIEKSFLTNRPKFNYIETKGVSIQCKSVPKSVSDDLASLFNGGVRIWHVKPSPTTDNYEELEV